MARLQLQQRIRYPPFEPHRFEPAELPIATSKTTLYSGKKKDMMAHIQDLPPSFTLGNESSWFIEQKYLLNGQPVDDSSVFRSENSLEENKRPRIIKKQRRGWYLTPNPIHAAVRNFISKSVVILLIALAYLFIEPFLRGFGIIGFGTGTVRIGLLDYPMLAIIVIPLLIVPLLLRVGANLVDLVRQQNFLKSEPMSPVVTLTEPPTAGQALKFRIQMNEMRDDWKDINITWRVGALPPARGKIFDALGLSEADQPPPGLTTELPHHWEIGLDDGTGGGEKAPMESRETKGGLFLRPMRSMESGGSSPLTDTIIELEPPQLEWPGTVSSELIRIHWELIVRIQRSKGGPLLWVLPIAVRHPQTVSLIQDLPTNDGRAESVQV